MDEMRLADVRGVPAPVCGHKAERSARADNIRSNEYFSLSPSRLPLYFIIECARCVDDKRDKNTEQCCNDTWQAANDAGDCSSLIG